VETTTLKQATLDRRLVDRGFADFAAAMTLPLVRVGDRLGFYGNPRDHGPSAPAELHVWNRIVSKRFSFDRLELLTQIEATPAPGQV
jgi:hypothetical protein